MSGSGFPKMLPAIRSGYRRPVWQAASPVTTTAAGTNTGHCRQGTSAISTILACADERSEPIEPPVERELEVAAAAVDGRADRAIRLASCIGSWLPNPGDGRTAQRWRALTAAAVGDLTAARVAEAHTDALSILAEATGDPGGLPDRPPSGSSRTAPGACSPRRVPGSGCRPSSTATVGCCPAPSPGARWPTGSATH